VCAGVLEPVDDEEMESALAVPLGWLRRVRRLPGRAFAAARHEGKPVGVVAYEPITSSTPILRAETPAVARALLETVRHAHRPGQESVRLHIDENPALVAAVASIGGRVMMRTLRMHGPLTR